MSVSKRVQEAQKQREAFLEKYRALRVPIPEEEFYRLANAVGEEYTVSTIRRYLLTEPQRLWLFEQNVSIEDLLNGRFDGHLESEVGAMFRDWNAKLGSKHFLEF
jgi:hypothetical protein